MIDVIIPDININTKSLGQVKYLNTINILQYCKYIKSYCSDLMNQQMDIMIGSTAISLRTVAVVWYIIYIWTKKIRIYT